MRKLLLVEYRVWRMNTRHDLRYWKTVDDDKAKEVIVLLKKLDDYARSKHSSQVQALCDSQVDSYKQEILGDLYSKYKDIDIEELIIDTIGIALSSIDDEIIKSITSIVMINYENIEKLF